MTAHPNLRRPDDPPSHSRFTIECPWCYKEQIWVQDGSSGTCSLCGTTVPTIRLDDVRVFRMYHTIPSRFLIQQHHGWGDDRYFHDSMEYGLNA